MDGTRQYTCAVHLILCLLEHLAPHVMRGFVWCQEAILDELRDLGQQLRVLFIRAGGIGAKRILVHVKQGVFHRDHDGMGGVVKHLVCLSTSCKH